MAVAAVVVVIIALLAVNGHPANGPTPSVVTTPNRSTASPVTTPSPTRAPRPPVRVLNNSTRQGLAHQVARELRARGWRVVEIGNLRGRLAATTLYFAPGNRAAAHRLAGQFASVQRVEPNAAGRIRKPDLTLVVTRYWRSSGR